MTDEYLTIYDLKEEIKLLRAALHEIAEDATGESAAQADIAKHALAGTISDSEIEQLRADNKALRNALGTCAQTAWAELNRVKEERKMPDETMTLVERLRNPKYVGHMGGNAILDTKRTLADMRAAADRIEVQQAFGRAAAEMIDKSGA